MNVPNSVKDEDKTNKENKSILQAPGSTTHAGGPGTVNPNSFGTNDGIERREFDKMLKILYIKQTHN